MTLVKRSRILELYKLTHLKEKKRFYLFKQVRIQSGLVLGDRQEN
jgi:hypothetical protein